MPNVPNLKFNNGVEIPQLGYGVWQVPDDEVTPAVRTAIEVGYRHIDTAAIYGNEAGTGRAIAESGVPREELFVTTKLWNSNQGYDSTLRAFDESVGKLGLDYVDLYLIHWPAEERGAYVDSWGGIMKSKEVGNARSIGVSNFTAEHLSNIIDLSFFVPAVNQVELHPRLNQAELRATHAEHDIVTEAYSPLGVGRLLDEPTVTSVGQAHGKTPAQVLTRWSIQLGNVVIPRSSSPDRMKENLDVFDFELTENEMTTLNGLDDGTRFRPNPDTYSGT